MPKGNYFSIVSQFLFRQSVQTGPQSAQPACHATHAMPQMPASLPGWHDRTSPDRGSQGRLVQQARLPRQRTDPWPLAPQWDPARSSHAAGADTQTASGPGSLGPAPQAASRRAASSGSRAGSPKTGTAAADSHDQRFRMPGSGQASGSEISRQHSSCQQFSAASGEGHAQAHALGQGQARGQGQAQAQATAAAAPAGAAPADAAPAPPARLS